MTITAKVIEDSISTEGVRITTFQLRYPRFIHAEFMTHRLFSRNASSSRAIPVKRLIADIRKDPAMPVYWGSNKPGMQAGAELTGWKLTVMQYLWLAAMYVATFLAGIAAKLGAAKEIVNRIIENFGHINVVATSTDYSNFFALRRHPDAQPEIKVLADRMFEALEASKPELLYNGQWHLPYITEADYESDYSDEDLVKVSVARCARVSYKTHDGRTATLAEEMVLYERLVGSVPLHASPAEHQATPDKILYDFTGGEWYRPWLHGNFSGWIQNRKLMPGECQ